MKRTRRKAVQLCLDKGECVLPDCSEPLDRRGLCRQHYGQFYYELRTKKSDAEKRAFERAMIYEGLVLDAYEQRTRRRSNPFAQTREEDRPD